MEAQVCRVSGWRGAQSLLGAILLLAATPGAATIAVADAAPVRADVGLIASGVNATAGGAGLLPAGDSTLHDAGWPPAAVRHQDAAAAASAAVAAAASASTLGIILAALVDPIVIALLAAGVAMMVAAAWMRRRHRRRIGWGVLPDRTA